jgi:hypothetical protein
MMRKRDQVDGGRLGLDLDVGKSFSAATRPLHDGTSGCVANMQNSAARVRCFLTPDGRAFGGVIENYAGRALEDFIEQRRAFIGENTRRLRRRHASSGCNDVFKQQLRTIVGPAADYAALRVTSV